MSRKKPNLAIGPVYLVHNVRKVDISVHFVEGVPSEDVPPLLATPQPHIVTAKCNPNAGKCDP